MKTLLPATKESLSSKILAFDSMENLKFFRKRLILFSTPVVCLDDSTTTGHAGSNDIKQGGYIALTSVIIISLLLITIITALSSVNYFSRYNILENEFKERSLGLAEACVDYAFAKLAANSSYTGNETVAIGTDTCKVVQVASNGILTQGIFQKSYTNLCVSYTSGTLAINSWKEMPVSNLASCP
jgi:hypothetical protein